MTRLAIVALAVLAGCTTIHPLEPVGGSKEEGVVELGYKADGTEWNAQHDPAQGLRVATRRCQDWGYQTAEQKGESSKRCMVTGGMGTCYGWEVIVRYQCRS